MKKLIIILLISKSLSSFAFCIPNGFISMAEVFYAYGKYFYKVEVELYKYLKELKIQNGVLQTAIMVQTSINMEELKTNDRLLEYIQLKKTMKEKTSTHQDEEEGWY